VCGAALRPLPDNRIDFKFLSNFDPKVRAVPYNLLNWFSRKFAKGLFKKVQKKAWKLDGTEYIERRTWPEKRGFYEFVTEALANFDYCSN
jgi:hypothetical protein